MCDRPFSRTPPIGDPKIGQYTELPPHATFSVQAVGSIVRGLLNFVIMKTIIFVHDSAFNSVAIAWGAFGKPLYATGTRSYMQLVGLLFPVPFWLLHKKYPKFGFNLVFTPVLTGQSVLPDLRKRW
ncbi:hypothetical protein B0H14DRAFT_3573537 [Mycena olivaceomarginata]|nr:hypothetical protein B0H14DRAFT_3573537 [Mycena olivaceomarginata]